MSSSLSFASSIEMHGSTTVLSHLVLPNKMDIETQSGQTFNIIANGSGNGLKNLVNGTAHIGMISAPLEHLITKVNQKAPDTLPHNVLIPHQVGEAHVAFTVHPSNPVKNLTLEQITNILNGTTRTWQTLGGVDAPIVVIVEISGGGLRTVVERELLATQSIAAYMKRELQNALHVPSVVAQVPHAFGIMSTSLVNDNVVQIQTDQPVAQPLIFVTKGDPSPAVQSVIDATKKISGL